MKTSMTIHEIRLRIDVIASLEDENDIQHVREDRLFQDFVKAIINDKYETKEQIIKAAEEVIKVLSIDYTRWYE